MLSYAQDGAMVNRSQNIYDVFISYSHKDRLIAHRIIQSLQAKGICARVFDDAFLSNDSYLAQIEEAIRNARVYMILLTENSIQSDFVKMELELAITTAKERSKAIVPVSMLPNSAELPAVFRYQLMAYHWFNIGPLRSDYENLSDAVTKMIRESEKDTYLSVRIAEYISAGLNDQAADLLCDQIRSTSQSILQGTEKEQRACRLSLLSCLEKLSALHTFGQDEAARQLAHKKLQVLDHTAQLLFLLLHPEENLYDAAFAIRLLHYERHIRIGCSDVLADGETDEGNRQRKEYERTMADYTGCYRALLPTLQDYSEAEKQFIQTADTYINAPLSMPVRQPMPAQSPHSTEDELLSSIATFMHEGNKVFDLISQRHNAKSLYSCLLTSYERLRGYCEAVGERSILPQCIDRIAQLKQIMIKTGEGGKAPEKVDAGIKSLLGLTVPKSGKFDVFISHKSQDFDLALNIYEFLRSSLKEPFFDKFSLPEMNEAQYRKSIMQALDASRHFVVVFSDLAYLKSDWVSLEMEVFQSEMDEGRKPGANFLMIVTKSVYDQIMQSNKTLLPIEYRRCEIMCMDDYREKLLNYLNR